MFISKDKNKIASWYCILWLLRWVLPLVLALRSSRIWDFGVLNTSECGQIFTECTPMDLVTPNLSLWALSPSSISRSTFFNTRLCNCMHALYEHVWNEDLRAQESVPQKRDVNMIPLVWQWLAELSVSLLAIPLCFIPLLRLFPSSSWAFASSSVACQPVVLCCDR